jgi:hypothetical protein
MHGHISAMKMEGTFSLSINASGIKTSGIMQESYLNVSVPEIKINVHLSLTGPRKSSFLNFN